MGLKFAVNQNLPVDKGAMMRRIYRTILALSIASLLSLSYGQEPTPKAPAKSDGDSVSSSDISKIAFATLLGERDKTTGQIEILTQDITWLDDALDKEQELKKAAKAHKPTEEIEKSIEQSKGYAHVPTNSDSDKEKALKQAQLKDMQKRKDAIDAELDRRAEIVGPEQQFKRQISIIFAWLVGAVIAGFFIIAGIDESVRREIFSGQAGIQFVTLFSLVIAIILFGIIGILEGKELAALLGGLSGYILGRSMSKSGNQT